MPTILIVDDMAIFREPIDVVLRREGYETLIANDGAEALSIMSQRAPDLVLLDMDMPRLDGLETLRAMRRNSALKDVPVMILSAEADRARVVPAISLGVCGYILKSGFSLQKMLVQIRAFFEGGAPGEAVVSSPAAAFESGSARVDTVRRGSSHSSLLPSPATSRAGAKPLTTRSELLKRLASSGDLKGFSPTIGQVLKMTADSDCSIEGIARVVGRDHATALKILKLANSAAYTRGDRVESVHKAVIRIGLGSIRHAAMSIGVIERFGAVNLEEFLSAPQFWEHAIATGIIGAQIAHEAGHADADVAFTAGLLHDVGRLILADLIPNECVDVMRSAARLGTPLEEQETRMLQLNHAEAMDSLLRAWKLPKELAHPIVSHHVSPAALREAPARLRPAAMRLALADRLAHALMLGSSGNETIYPIAELCEELGLDAGAIARIEGTAREQTDDAKLALLSHSREAVWPERAEHHRAAMQHQFRPLFIGAAPETDAVRIFCDALAEGADEGAPNVAVVHIAKSRDREALGDALLAAEKRAGGGCLPALIVSPEGTVDLRDDVARGRPRRTIATPFAIARFTAAATEMMNSGHTREAA